MKHSTRKPTKAQAKRLSIIKSMMCIACVKEGCKDVQCGPTECHHLNFDGKAGQKRLGHDHVIPLGAWHHRSVPLYGVKPENMRLLFGPSLALQSKAFRAAYGSDQELLAEVNAIIEQGEGK